MHSHMAQTNGVYNGYVIRANLLRCSQPEVQTLLHWGHLLHGSAGQLTISKHGAFSMPQLIWLAVMQVERCCQRARRSAQ